MMKLKAFALFCLMIALATGVALAQEKKGADPISGTWSGDWGPSANDRNQVTVDLKYDGKALTGTVNPGPNAVQLAKSTFDPATGAVHMEADAKNPRGGPAVHYVIDGKIANGVMSGTWNHDNRKGDFKITKK
jgi:uncharacterized protein (DUF2147 family)